MSEVWVPRIVNLSSTDFEYVHTQHDRNLKFRIPAKGSLVLEPAVNKVPWQWHHYCMKLTAKDDGTYYSVWKENRDWKDRVRSNRNGPPEPGYGAPIAGDSDSTHNFVGTLVINEDKSVRMDRSYSKTTLTAWKVPLGRVPVLNKEIGDHTWAVGDDGFCEPCRFGVKQEEGVHYYCSWQNGRYAPRREWTRINTASGLTDWARLMGGKPYKEFGTIPGQGNVLYAVNGVCHTLTNRLLWRTGVEVEGAKGYDFIRFVFGRDGTNVPGKLVTQFVPGFDVLVAIYQLKVALDWNGMRGMFGPQGDSSFSTARAELERSLDKIHEPLISTLDTELSANDLHDLAQQAHERHMQELDLLDELEDSPLTAGKKTAHRTFWQNFHQPPANLRETLKREYPKVNLQQALQELEQRIVVSPDELRAGATRYSKTCLGLQNELARLLGAEDYEAVYGRKPDEPLMILDPKIIAAA